MKVRLEIYGQGGSPLKIVIENFKSIGKVEFEPGNVNVLIGANGSGKSAILEAIGVLGAAVSGEVSDNSLMNRGVRVGTPALYKSSFKDKRISNTISFSIEDWNKVSYQVNLSNPIEDPKPKWEYFSESLHYDGSKVFGRSRATKYEIPLMPGISLEADRGLLSFVQGLNQEALPFKKANDLYDLMRSYKIYTPYTSFLRGLTPDPAQSEPLGLNGGRLAEVIADLLVDEQFGLMEYDEIFDLIDWAVDLKVAAPTKAILSQSVPAPQKTIRFKDAFMRDERNELTAYDASEGSLYVLFTLALAMHKNAPNIFAVDNFNQALHPRLARKLTTVFSDLIIKQEKICFLTTHNPLVLDGLNLHDDRIRLFVLQRTSKGVTTIERIKVSEKLLQENVSLSQLWLMGRLGGVPNI